MSNNKNNSNYNNINKHHITHIYTHTIITFKREKLQQQKRPQKNFAIEREQLYDALYSRNLFLGFLFNIG